MNASADPRHETASRRAKPRRSPWSTLRRAAAAVAACAAVRANADAFSSWKSNVFASPPAARDFVTGSGRGRSPAVDRTELWAARLPDGIGFAIRAANPEPGSGRDVVEICLDVNRDGEQAFAVAVGSDGTVEDFHYFVRDYADASWASDARSTLSVVQGDSQWTAVFMIPHDRLGVVLSPGDCIGIGVERQTGAAGAERISAWPTERRVHSWWLRRLVQDPAFFARTTLSPDADAPHLVSTSRGRLSARAVAGENAFTGYFANPGSSAASYEFDIVDRYPDGRQTTVWQRAGALAASARVPILADYPVPATGSSRVFRGVVDGRVVYESVANRDFSLPPRIHDIGGDFDPSRVNVEANAPAVGPLIFPLHLRDGVHLHSYSALARPYSLESVLTDMAANRELPCTTIRADANYNDLATRSEAFRSHGIQAVFYPDVADRAARRPTAERYLVEDRYRYLPTAAFREDYFASLREGLENYKDLIFGVFVSDELDRMFHRGLEFAIAHPDAYPVVREIDDAIRNEFGFGRHGLVRPETSAVDRPYCRIATQRWLNNWIAGLTDEVATTVRAVAPGVRVLGDDPQGGVFPYDYARRWRSVDIVLHQTYDKPLPTDQATSFVVKLVRDVAGKPFWPCVHLSGMGYDLDEMREIMSRAFRNGATGMTVFNGGGDFGTENEIAPERWAYMNQIARFYAKGNRVVLPEQSRMAFLYSNYDSMTDYSRGLGAVHNLLGPASDAWFRVIDDCSIERGDVDLSRFDVIFVQFADYSTPQVVRALSQAVQAGATLVLTTPEAFTRNIDGTSLEEGAALRGGVQFASAMKSARVVPGAQARGSLRNVRGLRVSRAREVRGLPEGASVLFAFEDGAPAVVSVPSSAGRVISFGFNPFWDASELRVDVTQCPTQTEVLHAANANAQASGMENSEGAFFRALLVYLNVPLDASDIWRMKLPAPETHSDFDVDKGFSLTGNAIIWSLGRPRWVRNAPPLGRYRFSVPPKGGTTNWTSFAQGLLTDRVTALRERRRREESVQEWNANEALAIDIDLGHPAQIKAVELIYEDAIPALRLLARKPGGEWEEVARATGESRTHGVHRIAMDRLDANARELRLEIGERAGDRKLALIELDVFGTPRP